MTVTTTILFYSTKFLELFSCIQNIKEAKTDEISFSYGKIGQEEFPLLLISRCRRHSTLRRPCYFSAWPASALAVFSKVSGFGLKKPLDRVTLYLASSSSLELELLITHRGFFFSADREREEKRLVRCEGAFISSKKWRSTTTKFK